MRYFWSLLLVAGCTIDTDKSERGDVIPVGSVDIGVVDGRVLDGRGCNGRPLSSFEECQGVDIFDPESCTPDRRGVSCEQQTEICEPAFSDPGRTIACCTGEHWEILHEDTDPCGHPWSPQIEVTLENLGDLGDDYVYETWLITDDGPISAGRFPMNDANESFWVDLDADLATAAQMYVLTIEPAVGDDPAPAATHVVAGAFDEDGTAELSIGHPAAFNNDFTTAMGEYFLQTPTSPDVADDYNQGLWFVIPGVGPSLLLPELPAGWVYEGWVVDENGPVSTGRFVDPAAPDSDGAGPAAGPGGAPPFPGQDFIDPARDLVGNTIVITVEPEPDNSPAPFFFKPLVDMNAEGLGAGVFQSLANQANSAPRGVAVIR